jgi:hypothetical protein
MATAPANTMQMKPRRDMVEVKAPAQFKFTKQGEIISGVLVRIEPTTVNGKEAIEYLFQNPDGGARFTCLGTNDLDKKLNPQMIGHYVEIRYEADDSSFQKPGQNPMKVFRVSVSKEIEPGY